MQSALAAAGIQAQRIEHLWWVMFWVTLIVTVIVLGALAFAVRRGAGAADVGKDDRPLARYISIATGISIVILIGLLVESVITSRAIASQRDEQGALEIEVVAYQWWWSAEYQHPDVEQRVRTANELHIPVGKTVAIKLLAGDVIHSFWVPSLHGKLDAIPGHAATLWLRADTAGVYRGQCAEYCGHQHAHMAFVVIAEAPEEFERWIQAQRQTAHPPSSELEQRGLQVVQQSACVMCHTVRGTAAGGRIAPDLTHLATRATIASGTLPRTPDNLRRWIRDPQSIKPGSRMPNLALPDNDIAALVAYLEQLK
ncbi:MAG TPA: cytochrome c oxidase subunit II [Vicinamibacterales bacterium]|nr:cytochrome c oxidase subunit II [Vicinamibacterales bacterium]